MVVWLPFLFGALDVPTAFDPSIWHAHEMVFGFAGAAVTGYVLTLIPNWTGTFPLQGRPLAVLLGLWVAGRLAVACSAVIGAAAAMGVDLALPTVLLTAALREVVTGRNWRNLPILAALSLLVLANALTHLEPLGLTPTAALGVRAGLATLLGMIALVGGRLVPSFTRNRLMRRREPILPAAAGPLDRTALGLAVAALIAWTVAPASVATALLALAGGLATAIRQLRWRPHRIGWDPILLGLHLGYGWLALGLILLGQSLLVGERPSSLAVHALAAGAVGTMILSVMCRTGLAHTGRVPVGDTRTTVAGLLVTAAAVLRILAELLPDHYPGLLDAAAATWIGGFVMFLTVYTPILARSSISAKRRPGSPP